MKDVNLLVCSDLHSSEEALEMICRLAVPDEYDLAIICGDFTTMGSLDYVDRLMKGIKGVMVLAVPGNCDYPEIVDMLVKRHASLHNKRYDFGGWQFFGFGGSVPTSSGMPFEVDEKIIESSLRKIGVREGVMVTHQPAYGMNDLGRSGSHGGSRSILKIAKEFVPRLALSGHMHESRGTVTADGTVFVNPGSARNGFYASIWLGSEVRVKLNEEKFARTKPKMF